MIKLNRFRIKARLYSGFGALIIIGLIVAGFGTWELGTIGAQVDRLVLVSESSSRNLQVGQLGEKMQRTAVRYKMLGDESQAKEFDAAEKKAVDLVETSAKYTRTEEQRQGLRDVGAQIGTVKQNFDKLVLATSTLADGRNKLVKGGSMLVAASDKLLAAARGLGNPETAMRAAEVEKSVLLMRLATVTFMTANSAQNQATFKSALDHVDAAIGNLEQSASDGQLAPTAAALRAVIKERAANFDELAAAMQQSDQIFDVIVTDNAKISKELETTDKEIAAILKSVKAATGDTIGDTTLAQEIMAGLGLALGLALAYFIGRSIIGPVTGMTAAMRKLATGDTMTEIPAQDAKDEIGDMAKAVDVFKQNMIRADELAAEQRAEQEQKSLRQATIEQHIAAFETGVRVSLNTLTSAATEMRATSQGMSATAAETSAQASTVAAAAEEASVNVQTVAAATEELSSSVAEIGRQVTESTRISGQAVDEASRTNATVQGLSAAAQKIGDVVKLISDIASQTNLLALNATIEAARAGDAGKGFAVVASEVKSLANQTAKATGEISAQVTAMQSATADAVLAIGSIGGTIGSINEIAATIASAVEEQGAATQEIARNVQEAAQGTNQVSSTIAGVNQAAGETGVAASQVLTSSEELGRQAQTLRADVDGFLAKIRAA